ncbi:GNAT family N-acetyltransferase [Thalassorhabdomicrobium marinisediminis]|uniref:Aminoglycoside 6'-acetyltransferase n=1 Tax=Thalassorhabdomicrobium marinisediminis TaxID=2170577 RepID=A0A2T7FX02_9RHOB|nr:GNAT family N-acetyltransferase [Thalassorhabdomicrobium marinisediminis]PVA06696.1 aminoglycoside 6'-acetyltransferase [Thalassorhabdomicrobium marinisediminis]
MFDLTFRPMTRTDLPMFRRWLDQPHMGGWWGDSGTEARLVEQDMDKGVVDMRVVEHDGDPFAFIQDYNAHAFGAPHYKGFDKDARAIDTFLGDPAYLGQGYGAGYIAARVADLRSSYPVILTDPDPANTRAIAAYRRAGFTRGPVAPAEDGRPVQVMTYH